MPINEKGEFVRERNAQPRPALEDINKANSEEEVLDPPVVPTTAEAKQAMKKRLLESLD
jgi:hypothetical protein